MPYFATLMLMRVLIKQIFHLHKNGKISSLSFPDDFNILIILSVEPVEQFWNVDSKTKTLIKQMTGIKISLQVCKIP